MIYVMVIFMLLFLVIRYDINSKKKYRNECYVIMLIIFILIAGLRYRLGIDTTRYLNSFYYYTPTICKITLDDIGFGNDPLFVILNSIVLTFGGKFYVVQLLNAAFVNILLFKYIKKHTDAIFTCIFIYFVWKYTVINMEEMRASMSLAVCLFANDYMMEKRWIKGLSLYVIGCLFHVSTILVFFLPLFYFLRLNKFGILFIFGSFLFGFFMQSIVNDYLELLEISETIDDKAQRYISSEEYMESHLNIVGIISALIVNVYGIFSIWWLKRESVSGNFLKLEPLAMIFLCFSMIAIGIPIVHRYDRFYIIYFIIFIAEFIINLIKKQTCIGKDIIVMRTLIVMFPLLILIAKERFNKDNWGRYHPYSSIFDQEIDMNREKIFSVHKGYRQIPGKY